MCNGHGNSCRYIPYIFTEYNNVMVNWHSKIKLKCICQQYVNTPNMYDLDAPSGWLDLFIENTFQHTHQEFYNMLGMPPETLPVCPSSLHALDVMTYSLCQYIWSVSKQDFKKPIHLLHTLHFLRNYGCGHQNHGLWMMCDAEKHRLRVLDGVHALDANLDEVCADLLNNFSFILLILFAILPD